MYLTVYCYYDMWGEGVPILDCNLIEFSIVLHKPELAILLLNKEDWGREGRLGGADISLSEVVFEEAVQLLLLIEGHGVDLGTHGFRGSRDDFDGVVPGLVLRKSF